MKTLSLCLGQRITAKCNGHTGTICNFYQTPFGVEVHLIVSENIEEVHSECCFHPDYPDIDGAFILDITIDNPQRN